MINLIYKTIAKEIPNVVGRKKLYFLKYSTHSASQLPNAKVIIFAFREGVAVPTLVIKTVRSYERKGTILRNFDNLSMLNETVAGSPYAEIFPKALFLHDDGENVFSVETACPGRRIKLDQATFDVVVSQYTDLAQFLARKENGSLIALEILADEMIESSGFNDRDRTEIKKFFLTLAPDNIAVPRLLQHGDITEDNLLLSEGGLHIMDCDLVGRIHLPGFDLFGLFYRYKPQLIEQVCYKYLPGYFQSIGAQVGENYHRLFFLYFFTERVIRKVHLLERLSAEQVIADYKKIFSDSKL